jgi:nitroimidazol reductase NimA-like FMN-containing flavoprotein (pyridoxamine 5'-phosphate oxidase superfamily)
MRPDDPAALDVLRRSMVARIATLSHNGRPSINPLYFISHHGHIWLGTVEWTLAARNVKADPRVSVLFEVEQDPRSHRVLRISGQASVRTEQRIQRSYALRVARKYLLTPGGIGHYVTHIRQFPAMHQYHAQAAEKGRACVIEVIPQTAQWLEL